MKSREVTGYVLNKTLKNKVFNWNGLKLVKNLEAYFVNAIRSAAETVSNPAFGNRFVNSRQLGSCL